MHGIYLDGFTPKTLKCHKVRFTPLARKSFDKNEYAFALIVPHVLQTMLKYDHKPLHSNINTSTSTETS